MNRIFEHYMRTTIALLLVLSSLVGCSSIQTIEPESELATRVVRMDRDGSPMDLEGKKIGITTFRNNQLTKITTAIEKFAKRSCGADDWANTTIAIYVHGAPLRGEVKLSESVQKLRAITSTNPKWYPIAFNWQGSLGDVYVDHLFRIRNGHRISGPRGAVSSPFYFIGDFLTSVARIPGTWFDQSVHIMETEYPQSDISGTRKEAQRRQTLAVEPMQVSASLGASDTENEQGDSCTNPLSISNTLPNDPKFSPVTLVQFPIEAARKLPHLVVSPAISSFGSSMWKNYNRRVQASIRQGKEYEEDTESLQVGDETSTGAFAILLDELIKKFKFKEEKPEIVLIGHSTGTMIISEYIGLLLERGGVKSSDGSTKQNDNLSGLIDKIVFLGSAATIAQFNKTVVPYLQSSNTTKFYNISLNAYDEAKTSWYGLQTMSLLEWLDNAIARPESHAARVMGKWENMMLAMHTIPCEVRDQVYLKHLPSEDGFPRSHSELDEVLPKFNAFNEKHWGG